MQIGIDLGATKIEYVLLDNNNKELLRNRIETPKNYSETITSIISIIKDIENKNKNNLNYEWGESVDRIFAGIELFNENKSQTLILTRGKLPWSVGIPEGEYLREVAIKFGVPEKNILLTENVENTDQEAKAIKKLFSINSPKVILVTSAFHMPRAQTVFEAAGINIVAFPVDFQSGESKLTLMSFIPSANSLSGTSFFVREMIGRTYYKLKY